MTVEERVKATPRCDWPVAKKELSGPGKFFSLYGGEHIAATEFVIGATLVQYGCSASDILIGLAIGNLLATLCFALLCAPLAVDTRLSLYTYLSRVVGVKVQKLYNLIFGIGFAALGATGICISATAIRRVLNVPIQHEWYPTSPKFVLIVIVLGIVIVGVAANGFEGVAGFAEKCVPWMIVLFGLAYICVLPELADITGFGKIHSLTDVFRLLDQHVWVQQKSVSGESLGIIHVVAFAWTCNVALHLGLNDMSVLRYAKSSKYGYISAVGMFIGHYFAWIGAGIMGATASVLLNTNLAMLDSGEVSFSVLGYAGLLGVVIAGWTTANPTIYRVTLSFNSIFTKFSYKKMTYIIGTIIVIASCFPCVQRASDVLTYLGLLVAGMGAVCITEHFVFPKIGYTRYWNMYKKSSINWAALIAWGLSLVFFVIMLITKPIHQNFWFIPTFFIAMISYIILAGLMGARKKYPEEEKKELEYEEKLQEYVNENVEIEEKEEATNLVKIINVIRYILLVIMVITGIAYARNVITVGNMKQMEFIWTIVYFVGSVLVTMVGKTKNR